MIQEVHGMYPLYVIVVSLALALVVGLVRDGWRK